MPQISVIVPVYKVEPYLCRCVDSILGQTFTDFELILVDDGSPDRCPAICDEYAQKDSRVIVIHQENGGLSAARNTGIDWTFANSDSQWLTFIDSDDWVHPQYLEKLLHAAVESGLPVSICGYFETAGNDPVFRNEEMNAEIWLTEDYYVEHMTNATIACAKLYQKKCFQAIRYPVGKLHEDEFTTYRVLFAVESIAVISDPLYCYYQNLGGITKSSWKPGRIDGLDAHNEQIRYFENNQFDRAKMRAAWAVIWGAQGQINDLMRDCPQDRESLHILRSFLRRSLGKYRKVLQIRVAEYPGLYETAYPKTMQIYWYLLAAMRKLRKR